MLLLGDFFMLEVPIPHSQGKLPHPPPRSTQVAGHHLLVPHLGGKQAMGLSREYNQTSRW